MKQMTKRIKKLKPKRGAKRTIRVIRYKQIKKRAWWVAARVTLLVTKNHKELIIRELQWRQ